MPTNEELSYKVSVNLAEFEKQMQKLIATTVKTGQSASKGFKTIEKNVNDLNKSMDNLAKKTGRKYTAGTDDLQKSMNRVLLQSIKTKTTVVSSFKDIEKSTEKYGKSLKGVNQQQKKTAAGFSKTKKEASSLEKTIKKLAAGYLGLAGARKLFRSTMDIGQKVIEETGELQTAGERWKRLTGSVADAESTLKSLFDFSHRTPFTFKDVNKAATQLFVLTDGALQGTKAIEQLADRAALAKVPMAQLTTWWGRMYSAMQAGRPIGRALTRMQEMGIISGKLRVKMDALSEQDMMSGKGWETFIEGTKKADGSIESLSKTIEGKLSTLGGVWDALFAFDDKESQNQIAKQIQNMIDVLNKNTPVIQNILKDIFGVVGDVLTGAMITAVDLWKTLNPGKAAAIESQKQIAIISNQLKNLTPEELTKQRGALQKKGFDIRERFKAADITSKTMSAGLIENVRDEISAAMLGGDLAEVSRQMKRLDESTQAIIKEYIRNSEILKATNKQLLIGNKPVKAAGIPGVAGFTGGAALTSKKTKALAEPTAIVDTTTNPLFKSFNRPLMDRVGTLDDTGINQMISDESFFSGFASTAGIGIDKQSKSIKELNEKDREEAAQRQLEYYQKTENIISSSNDAILNIHEAFAVKSLSVFTRGMSGLASNTKSILGELGLGQAAGIGGIKIQQMILVVLQLQQHQREHQLFLVVPKTYM
jgi:hypothetical protein